MTTGKWAMTVQQGEEDLTEDKEYKQSKGCPSLTGI